MGSDTTAAHVVEALGRVPLFQGLPRADLERIAGLAKERSFRQGEFLFREGDPADRFYVVLSGAVEALKERPLGDHERLALQRTGDVFGELSLLDGAPRSASVRALEDTRLVSVSRAEFDDLLGGDSIGVRLLRGVAPALRELDVRFAAREPGGGGAEPLHHFERRVLRGLEPRTTPPVEGYSLAAGTARDAAGGGSLWDGFTTDDRRTLLALMDVRGIGLPPAYLIAITRALLHELGPALPFDHLLRRLNAATFRNVIEGVDECVETAVMEIRDGALSWSCAGEQPAVLLRRDGSTEEAAPHGPPLGILPHFDYGVTRLPLASGDTFLAFSEAPAGLVNGAVDMVRGRADADPAELARLLQTAFEEVRTRGAETDMAFVIIRRN